MSKGDELLKRLQGEPELWSALQRAREVFGPMRLGEVREVVKVGRSYVDVCIEKRKEEQ